MSALGSLSREDRELLRRGRRPESVQPMKARLTDDRFSDPDWIFERKLDGVRGLALRGARDARLISRTGKALDRSYPELVEALARQPCPNFVADGEIVAFDGGITSFAKLQGRMQLSDPDEARRSGIAVYLYLFDLLWVDGHDTRRLPLRSRKALLKRALSFERPVRYLSHRNRDGEKLYEKACRRGLEGLIAKRADSPYVHERTSDWLKFKCQREQEFVIGGFTAPKGSRTDFGALLVGYNENGNLRYAGKVGTGFDRTTLERLGRRMRGIERASRPFADAGPRAAGVRWVKPELVAQIAFTEWTRDGRLRHPRYVGLRDDKPAREVVRERPS